MPLRLKGRSVARFEWTDDDMVTVVELRPDDDEATLVRKMQRIVGMSKATQTFRPYHPTVREFMDAAKQAITEEPPEEGSALLEQFPDVELPPEEAQGGPVGGVETPSLGWASADSDDLPLAPGEA